MKVGKIWGVTEALWDKGAEVHRLDILPNHHCSWHKHEHKANAFFSYCGVLYIERRKSYGLVDVTALNPGEFTVVPAGEFHRFVTRDEPCKALEIYWPMPLSDDIVREDAGGSNEETASPRQGSKSSAHDSPAAAAAAATDGRSRRR